MQDDKEKILKDYEEKADKIIVQMIQTLTRAQRKADDEKYRNTLAKLTK